MSLEQQIDIIKKAGNLGESLPGLDSDSVIDNILENSKELKANSEIIEAEKKDNIDRGMTEENATKEAEKQLADSVEKIRSSMKAFIEEEIAYIKINYKIFKDGLDSIPSDVQLTTANILLPPAIAVPAATPNPIYAINLAKTTKNAISGVLNKITLAFLEIIKSSTRISYELPSSLLTLYNQLKVLENTISEIPL